MFAGALAPSTIIVNEARERASCLLVSSRNCVAKLWCSDAKSSDIEEVKSEIKSFQHDVTDIKVGLATIQNELKNVKEGLTDVKAELKDVKESQEGLTIFLVLFGVILATPALKDVFPGLLNNV